MIQTPYRKIPQIMGTQHPDNASAPYWEKDGDGFVSIHEEVRECASAFQDIGCEEYLWDWEGKYVDEGVIEKLLTEHHAFFSKKQIGKDLFLTFRIPNIWEEKGRSLARAFMNILTAEEFARDLDLHNPPLFEVILPMTDSAKKLIHMQKTFTELARVKHSLFSEKKEDFDYIEMIPLIEGVHSMTSLRSIVEKYREMHQSTFKKNLPYLRVFLARSDPALLSGMIPAVLGNKIALSELYGWSQDTGIPVYPWTGTGSLPFRGGLTPKNIEYFTKTYPGVRGVTIQSSFRYDHPLQTVKKAVQALIPKLQETIPVLFDENQKKNLKKVIQKTEKPYQETITEISSLIQNVSRFVPSRRERRLHIGLLGYGRKMNETPLPRAINFTAALYSIGIPPEIIGMGRGIAALSEKERATMLDAYSTLEEDIRTAGQYVNKENILFLSKQYPGIRSIQKDIEMLESFFGITLGPTTQNGFLHRNITSTLFFEMKKKKNITEHIVASGKIRKSLG